MAAVRAVLTSVLWVKCVSAVLALVVGVLSVVYVLPGVLPAHATESVEYAASTTESLTSSASVTAASAGVSSAAGFAVVAETPASVSSVVRERHVDVKLDLNVPREAMGASVFTYTATVTNQGPDAAEGTRFTLSFEPGTTGITWECTTPAEGTLTDAVRPADIASAETFSGDNATSGGTSAAAGSEVASPESAAGVVAADSVASLAGSCPADVQVKEGSALTAGEHPTLTGRIDSLPVGGQVVFTVKGKFPNVTSATAVFTATLPEGIVDDNLDSNRIQQQTALTPIPPSIRVTKTQDKELTAVGEERVYTVTYENTGDVDARISISDEVQFRSAPNGGGSFVGVPFSYSAECDAASSTMQCDSVNLRRGGEKNSRFFIISGKYVTIPPGKKLVLKVKLTVSEDFCVVYDKDVYVRNEAWAFIHGREMFADGSITNAIIEGKLSDVSVCSTPKLKVTKVQDKKMTVLGEERVYTVTYENTGNVDISATIGDKAVFMSALSEYSSRSMVVPFSYSAECDADLSTMSCDSVNLRSENGKSQEIYFWNRGVTIPAGKKLVLKVKLTVNEGSCVIYGKDLYVHNEAWARVRGNRGNEHFGDNGLIKATIEGWVSDIPACPRPKVKVTTVQDKEVTAVGEERVYTVTYENTGDVDAKLRFSDVARLYDSPTKNGKMRTSFSYFSECDASSSTMSCMYWWLREGKDYDSFVTFESAYATIPVGKKLVLKAKLTVNEDFCTDLVGDLYVSNRAAVSLDDVGSFAEGSIVEATVDGRVRCVDVSTKMVLSDYSPRVGERVQVATEVSNSVGVAEEVPFVVRLSTDTRSGQKVNVLTADARQDVTCSVLAGEAECPTSFTYDAEANTITGVIPRLPKNSAVQIGVNALLTTAAKYLKTYDVYAETPGIFADPYLGPEGSNRSSTTFSWVDEVTIPVPQTPTDITDPCGTDNAVWIKPEDTYTIRWELTDDGHLVAHTQAGYVFPDGGTSHDFGKAVDSGVLCVDLPDTPTVDDPCGADNAVWVKPEDSATIRWELTDDGHLVAHTQAGYAFLDGTRSHDYGTAADSGVPCHIPTLEIPMTGGKAADSIYAAGLILLFLTVCGATWKHRQNMRVRIYNAKH